MNILANLIKTGVKAQAEPVAPPNRTVDRLQLTDERTVGTKDNGLRSGRTAVYAVRVRDGFKSDILGLQAELQLERQRSQGKARKVTEGEVIELMLEVFKGRHAHDTAGGAVPIGDDVWHGVHEIARKMHCAPAEVIERLVVQKVAELGLLPRRT